MNCDKCYIGEITRLRQKRFPTREPSLDNREKTNTTEYKSVLAEHTAMTNHVIDWEGVSTLKHVPDWHQGGHLH